MPWELVYVEDFATGIEARRRERFLKSGRGRELWGNMLGTADKGAAGG
ncbi:MAG TPA: hypothetical protein VJM69_02235 [Dehalococcoidia bacterium]|nr:hypothetical protein [Dehalococcoidia bacterium]